MHTLPQQLVQRHASAREYLLSRSGEIERGAYWTEWSSKFGAKLGEHGYVNLGSEDYFPKEYDPSVPWQGGSSRIRALHDIPFSRLERHNTLTERDCFKVSGRTFQYCNRVKKHNYYFERISIEAGPVLRMLEIGAGAGILGALFHAEYGTTVFIVDLPEMLTLSSAFLMTLFPDDKFLLPNELSEGVIDPQGQDFVFLLPDQIHHLPDQAYDLCVNTASFMEMDMEEVEHYFILFDRCLADGGFVFCSNRMRKRTNFFKYPWNVLSDTQDVFLERFRAEHKPPRKNQFADRLRQRCRGGSSADCLTGLSALAHALAKGLFWSRWSPSALLQFGLPRYHRRRFWGFF